MASPNLQHHMVLKIRDLGVWAITGLLLPVWFVLSGCGLLGSGIFLQVDPDGATIQKVKPPAEPTIAQMEFRFGPD